MADQPAPQAAPAPAPIAPVTAPDVGRIQADAMRDRNAGRMARRQSAMAKIAATRETAADVEAAATVQASTAAAAKIVEPKLAPAPAPKVEAKAAPEATAKAPDVKPPDDPAAQRGLSQIEHARKRFLDEQASAKAELEVQRAEIAKLRQDAQGKLSSIDDLKKLELPSLLDKLGLDDTRLTQLSRDAYARTAEGQKDPRAKQAADEVRQRAAVSSIEERYNELQRKFDEQATKLEQTQKLIFQREYANKWADGALKEVPADKPTLFGRLHAKDAGRARDVLLAIGGELEKDSDAAPAASEVLAEYERRARTQLESLGIDVDAILAPPPAAKPAPVVAQRPVGKTLEVGATQITRPENLPATRDERRATALAKLRMRQRQTADQVS